MTASNRKSRTASALEMKPDIDVESLIRRKPVAPALHLNLRLSGDNAEIYEYLSRCTPLITDSLRVRDCIRIGAFILAMKEKGKPITLETPEGRTADLLDYVGAFYAQSAADTRKK